MPPVLGMPGPMVKTVRHLAKRAPRVRYSARRSRRPSRPSVICSPGKPARATVPLSTLMPGKIPWREHGRQRSAVLGRLPHCFFEEDHAADELPPLRLGEQQLAVVPAILLHRGDVDALEALLDGGK